MNISICAIARLENRYVKEWVDYHLGFGFSHIYLYDNNREGEERLSDVIDTFGEYEGKVSIIPYHDKDHWPQVTAYQDCWDNHVFDWIFYLDLDEFFTFGSKWDGPKNIEAFINRYMHKTDAILINWMCYGDNGKLEYSKEPVIERFPNPNPLRFSPSNLWGKQPVNGHIKTLVSHKAPGFRVKGPHIGEGNYRCCNADGEYVENMSWQPEQTYANAYIRHYISKTIGEYIDQKIKRGIADRAPGFRYPLYSFFDNNKPTIAKIIKYREATRGNKAETKPLKWWLKLWIKMWIITPLFVR